MTSPTPDNSAFPCPVCKECDHDLRGGILEFLNNIRENLTAAGETLLDACEADGAGIEEFAEATVDLVLVRRQINVLLSTLPEIATIKAVHAE